MKPQIYMTMYVCMGWSMHALTPRNKLQEYLEHPVLCCGTIVLYYVPVMEVTMELYVFLGCLGMSGGVGRVV